MKNLDVSVKHATSPSHRDRSRQVVILRRPIQPASGRGSSARSFNPFKLPAQPSSTLWSGPLSVLPQRDADASPQRNFRHNSTATHIAIGFRTGNRLESIANAHTAADLHVRPVS